MVRSHLDPPPSDRVALLPDGAAAITIKCAISSVGQSVPLIRERPGVQVADRAPNSKDSQV